MTVNEDTRNLIQVEVAYVQPDLQKIIMIEIAPGTSLIDAVRQSKIASFFPGLDIETSATGVFGAIRNHDYVVQANDRIEIYRPLLVDPKEARRRRAKNSSS